MSAAEAKPNPFAPPRASLDVPIDKGPRPRRVKVAVWLLCAAMGLNAVMSIAPWLGAVPVIPGETISSDAFGATLNVLLFGFLGMKVWQGRNWARWVVLVLVALGLLGGATMMLLVPAAFKFFNGARFAAGMAETVLQSAVIMLVFTGESRGWFRRGA